jgi:hypothetical protein
MERMIQFNFTKSHNVYYGAIDDLHQKTRVLQKFFLEN